MPNVHSPIIIQDTREQAPLTGLITKYPVEVATLQVGDYGIKGFSDWENPAFIVERKSLEDLVQSLTFGRERFFKEIEKLRAFRFAAVLVEATHDEVEAKAYRSQTLPQCILSSIQAIQVRTGVHVIWCGSSMDAAHELEGLVRMFIAGIEKDYRRLGKAAVAAEE